MDPPTTEATLASHDEDRISSLPDEVIANILSRLKLKQALATSLLSKRWRYLWITHVTDLDFDVKHLSRPSSKVGAKFVELVDGILQQYNKSGDRDRSLHRFRITNNDICTKYKSFIGRWIKFALSKQVKELELELWNHQQLCTRGVPKEYMLSSDIFADADADAEADTVLETWQQNSSQIPPTYGSSWTVGLRNLKHLTLKTVTVEGKFIDYLLANCLVLEQLVLRSCNFSKSKLRVSGQSLKLKVLQIKSCSYFTHIEIYDVNLVSLTYMGRDLPLRIENVPQLVELCIGGWQPTTLRPVLDGLSTSVSHIHILRLEFFDMEDSFIPEMPILKSVTQLEITLFGTDDVSLFCFAPFIEACPKLQTFMLKILEGNRVASTVNKREIQRIVGLPLPYLEFVKFHGFYGESTHYELVQYLMDNAVALKKLVVDTHPRLGAFKNYNKTDVVKEEMSKSRECAKEQLEGKFPSRVELVII